MNTTKVCTKCGETKGLSEFYRGKSYRDGHETVCKVCRLKQHSEYYKRNKEKKKVYKREWYNRNKSDSEFMKRRRASCKVHYYKNTKYYRAKKKKRELLQINRVPPWATPLDLLLIEHKYKTCPEGYHVDHIVPLQGETVSGLHVPWNLQHLPAEENLSKGNRYWPDMWEYDK